MFSEILQRILQGDISVLTTNKVIDINSMAYSLLNKNIHSDEEIKNMQDILHISNILYNNTDKNILPLEDGVYDLLLELYKTYDSNYQVGAEPVIFNLKDTVYERQMKSPFIYDLDKIEKYGMWFYRDLSKEVPLTKDRLLDRPFVRSDYNYINKRLVESKQNHPNLVGTLDKCKFVMRYQAEEKGVLNDSNVKILERDFFGKHIQMGILHPEREFSMVLELKYDGVSVVGDISRQTLISAISRGDTNQGIAADLSPIFNGYKFMNAPDVDISIKFEAIMTYPALSVYNQLKGKDYKNCRTAISGLISSSDGAKYRDLVTLVPLATSEDTDRLTEILFLNEYYNTGEYLRYAIVSGNYREILYQINRFISEAEMMRPHIPFMYDGVVVSYLDEDLIQSLGRVNSVNKYSCAIKFNPLKKQTIFTGYTYTVGQDGKITPMIHFNPVEFYGTIHDKSTGHSYERFKTLNLRIGDIIDVEYVNDVMPYVTKPDNSHNASNTNPVEEFINVCPSCGEPLVVSKTGKTMLCVNHKCPERNLKRIVSMFDKLNVKDFSEMTLYKIGKFSLSELLNINKSDIDFLGEVNSVKFMSRINDLKNNEIYDYNIIGSLGFTSVASEKWKLILNEYSIEELIYLYYEDNLSNSLNKIKGIGPLTVKTIEDEFQYFINDILTISEMNNIIRSKGSSKQISIRFTGFRDKGLMEYLQSLGLDASEKGVTKSTDILLIPYNGFTSSKTSKAGENTIIVDVNEFKDNMDKYLKLKNNTR